MSPTKCSRREQVSALFYTRGENLLPPSERGLRINQVKVRADLASRPRRIWGDLPGLCRQQLALLRDSVEVFTDMPDPIFKLTVHLRKEITVHSEVGVRRSRCVGRYLTISPILNLWGMARLSERDCNHLEHAHNVKRDDQREYAVFPNGHGPPPPSPRHVTVPVSSLGRSAPRPLSRPG